LDLWKHEKMRGMTSGWWTVRDEEEGGAPFMRAKSDSIVLRGRRVEDSTKTVSLREVSRKGGIVVRYEL
jgi:hypothetical protein